MKNNGFGLCGAHRTGKSTLARLISDRCDIPFVQTSVSDVFNSLGFDPAHNLTLIDRLKVQNAVLDACISKWRIQESLFVTDRTPIDFIAYMLASTRQEELTDELDRKVQSYFSRCLEILDIYFNTIIEVKPGIPVIQESGKASTMQSHIDHIALLVSGLCSAHSSNSGPIIGEIDHSLLDLDVRFEYCLNFINGEKYRD
jgi:hypothetical protein